MKDADRCPDCSRTEKFWAGCSHVECPQRKPDQADIRDAEAVFLGYEPVEGGYRKRPTTED